MKHLGRPQIVLGIVAPPGIAAPRCTANSQRKVRDTVALYESSDGIGRIEIRSESVEVLPGPPVEFSQDATLYNSVVNTRQIENLLSEPKATLPKFLLGVRKS